MLSTRTTTSWGVTAACVAALASPGCQDGDDADGGAAAEDDAGDPGEVEVEYLAPTDRLARISMALRGVRPSAQEFAAVEADPNALDPIVDGYLASPQFGATMRHLHDESLLVVADYFAFPAGFPPVGPLTGEDIYAINRSVMEAPLRLIEHVVMNDRPYSEIVTADYTLANGHVAAVWGIPYAGDGAQWVETRWEDGRDNAGILSDSWLYQRHGSTLSNANRGRANAISRGLLCFDFLQKDIVLDANVDLADPEVVANAVEDNVACAGCHQTLDPLASFFRGYNPLFVPFYTMDTCAPDDEECQEYPLTGYVPELFPAFLGVPMRDPVFFGEAGDESASLGAMIADDPRFSLCAAERFYAFFHQVDLEDVPLERAVVLQKQFLDSGLDAKALTRAIVMSEDFSASHVVTPDPAVTEVDPLDDVVGVKKARPYQVAQLIMDLTGFRWETDLSEFVVPELPYGFGKVDLVEDSFLGFRVLLGGTDAIFATRPSHTFSATTSLVMQTLAGHAAQWVVEQDFGGQPPRLLTIAPDTIDETAVRQQLVDLHLRMYSKRVTLDSEEVNRAYILWTAALAHRGDTRRAWTITLTAMLQDLNTVSY